MTTTSPVSSSCSQRCHCTHQPRLTFESRLQVGLRPPCHQCWHRAKVHGPTQITVCLTWWSAKTGKTLAQKLVGACWWQLSSLLLQSRKVATNIERISAYATCFLQRPRRRPYKGWQPIEKPPAPQGSLHWPCTQIKASHGPLNQACASGQHVSSKYCGCRPPFRSRVPGGSAS